MLRRLWIPIVLLMLAPLPAVLADEDDRDGAKHATEEWPLSALRAPRTVRGPELNAPADFQEQVEEPSNAQAVWDYVGGTEGSWIGFEESGGLLAVPSDVVREVLATIHADIFETYEHHALDALDDRLIVMGRPALLREVRRTYDWVLAGMAPSIAVDAAYEVTRPEARALASGRARLFPRRWTRVYLQRTDQPFCIDFNIEIAQESTAMDPYMVHLPEGQELYVRYHPGETLSLLEVWSGEIEHSDVRTIDIDPVRNVPEGNAAGKLSFPVSRLLRAHTVLVLPNGKASTHVLRFDQDGRETQLVLGVGAPPAAHPSTQTSRPRPVAVLRMDASAGTLDFGTRDRDPEAWIERMLSTALARGFEDDDLQLQYVSASGCVLAEGLPAVLAFARETLGAAEKRLQSARATVRVLTLSEAAYRKGSRGGDIRTGAPIAAEYLAGLRPTGSDTGARVSLPVLLGVDAGFRVGYSEPGLYDFDVEVAQQSAGLDPQTTAHFRGLSGMLRLDRRAGQTVVSLDGALAWADAAAGTIDLSFRPPVGMNLQHERWFEEPTSTRKVSLPAIGAGASPLEAEVALTGAAGTEHVLAVIVRGGEAHLVLVSVGAP
ncbi:MAG: hypothetical protein QNJ98_10075 [Planctomycetota bacterium]|nr:hypothetical protein [Planctomycetota bacterium]